MLLLVTIWTGGITYRLLVMESKMSVLTRQKDGSAALVENTENPLSKGAAKKARGRITAPTLQNSPSLPRVREEKVLAIRQQLAEGTYDLDKRLGTAVDRLLAAVTT